MASNKKKTPYVHIEIDSGAAPPLSFQNSARMADAAARQLKKQAESMPLRGGGNSILQDAPGGDIRKYRGADEVSATHFVDFDDPTGDDMDKTVYAPIPVVIPVFQGTFGQSGQNGRSGYGQSHDYERDEPILNLSDMQGFAEPGAQQGGNGAPSRQNSTRADQQGGRAQRQQQGQWTRPAQEVPDGPQGRYRARRDQISYAQGAHVRQPESPDAPLPYGAGMQQDAYAAQRGSMSAVSSEPYADIHADREDFQQMYAAQQPHGDASAYGAWPDAYQQQPYGYAEQPYNASQAYSEQAGQPQHAYRADSYPANVQAYASQAQRPYQEQPYAGAQQMYDQAYAAQPYGAGGGKTYAEAYAEMQAYMDMYGMPQSSRLALPSPQPYAEAGMPQQPYPEMGMPQAPYAEAGAYASQAQQYSYADPYQGWQHQDYSQEWSENAQMYGYPQASQAFEQPNQHAQGAQSTGAYGQTGGQPFDSYGQAAAQSSYDPYGQAAFQSYENAGLGQQPYSAGSPQPQQSYADFVQMQQPFGSASFAQGQTAGAYPEWYSSYGGYASPQLYQYQQNPAHLGAYQRMQGAAGNAEGIGEPLLDGRAIAESSMFDEPAGSIAEGMSGLDEDREKRKKIIVVAVAAAAAVFALILLVLLVLGVFETDAEADAANASSSQAAYSSSSAYGSTTGTSSSSSSKGAAGSVVYQYNATTFNGEKYSVKETVTFQSNGDCEFTTMEMTFPSADVAKSFTDTLQRDYGSNYTLDSLDGANATVTIDNSGLHLDREEYEDALRYSVEDLVVLKK